MEGLIVWLKSILSRFGAVGPEASDSIGDVDDSMQDQVEDQIGNQDGTMPDIYADEHITPRPDRKFLDPSSPDADETTGFNPYDTAGLHIKK